MSESSSNNGDNEFKNTRDASNLMAFLVFKRYILYRDE